MNMTATTLLDLCPPQLLPEVVVSAACESLSINDMEIRAFLRERMSYEAISAEIDRICQLSKERDAFGQFSVLGLTAAEGGYSCVYSGDSLLNWLHPHERQRLNQLKMAMPTSAEAAVEARERIKARLAQRKAAFSERRAVAA